VKGTRESSLPVVIGPYRESDHSREGVALPRQRDSFLWDAALAIATTRRGSRCHLARVLPRVRGITSPVLASVASGGGGEAEGGGVAGGGWFL